MKPFWLNPLVAACFWLAVPVQGFAQPIIGGAASIEATVANADRVVVGTLVELGELEPAAPSDGRAWCAATMVVEETIKGEHRRRLPVRLGRSAAVLADWKDRSARLLVAVQEEDGAAATVVEAIDLSEQDLEVLTADFTVLRQPEDVVRAATEAVRRMPGVRRIATFGLWVPHEALAGTDWSTYHGTILAVPVDVRLEKRARQAVRSERYNERLEGIRALRHFKSDENIVAAQALLDDPGWGYLHRAEENRGLEVKHFGVRQEAYRTLKSWGVAVDKPVIREETLKLDRVKSASLSNTEVTAADFRELERFENLESLFLWNAPVTDADLKQLARLTKLRDLYLAGTQVTDVGLKHLAALPNLQYLDLAGTRVTDDGLQALARLKHLQKIELVRTGVTDAGGAKLRRLRPDLEIER